MSTEHKTFSKSAYNELSCVHSRVFRLKRIFKNYKKWEWNSFVSVWMKIDRAKYTYKDREFLSQFTRGASCRALGTLPSPGHRLSMETFRRNCAGFQAAAVARYPSHTHGLRACRDTNERRCLQWEVNQPVEWTSKCLYPPPCHVESRMPYFVWVVY